MERRKRPHDLGAGRDRRGVYLAQNARRQADRLADLAVQQVNVEARRARVTAEAGPALSSPGSNDQEP
jgi:hypothetical protein